MHWLVEELPHLYFRNTVTILLQLIAYTLGLLVLDWFPRKGSLADCLCWQIKKCSADTVTVF